MGKILFAFLLITFLCFGANAAKPVKDTVKVVHRTIMVDSTNIEQRQFNAAALKAYKQDRDFNYTTKATWWERFWRWLWSKLQFSRGSERQGINIPYFKYILGALAIGLLVYAIIKYLGDDLRLFRKKTKEEEIPYSESLENIHEINFDAEIERAMAQHNYRLAVRLLYLRSLKQLSDARLINWQIEKTNSAYLNELKDNSQKKSFGTLTTQFEYVWYGDFPVDGRSFQNIYTQFQDFKKLVS